MYIYTSLIIGLLFSLNLHAQEIDYEQFRGKALNARIVTDIQELSFSTYDLSNTEKRMGWYGNVFETPPTMARSIRDLLYLLYTAPNKKKLKQLMLDPSLVENYQIKRTKNFVDNHLQPIHNLSLRNKGLAVYICKYKEIKNGKFVTTKSLQTQGVYPKGEQSHILIADNKDFSDIEYMVRELSSEALKQLLDSKLTRNKAIKELKNKYSRFTSKGRRINISELATAIRALETTDPTLWKTLTTI